MGGVGLDQAGFGDGGGGFEGVVEVDGSVGGAGEDLDGVGVSVGVEVKGRLGGGSNLHIGRRWS